MDSERRRSASASVWPLTATSTVNEAGARSRNTRATVLRAQAAVDMARLNLSYTVVTAPCDGCIGRRNLEEGQLVSPGQTVTTLIPAGAKWVTANFKERQIAGVTEGRPVEIRIDAFPGNTFRGHVTAVSNATGSKYALMPTDNATGNFVKIQQCIPVRISIDNASADETRRMAAGMMCEVKVRTR